MASPVLSIKLRCSSWQQLATIYRRDLSHGAMFLKSSTQPALGTIVRIDLELPSATVIELSGTIVKHVVDPQRGTGVELQLEPLPTKSVWMIESALAAETKVRAASQGGDAEPQTGKSTGPVVAIHEGQDIAAAETELVRALEAEVESLRKLNPFLVLGVGYETTDADVRAAFGELTKRYHPDRFARYQSAKLRQVAAEIFILIRDAYRKLADAGSRAQVLASIGPRSPARQPARAPAPPTSKLSSQHIPTIPRVAVPPIPPPPAKTGAVPKVGNEHDAPTNPSAKSAQLASTELARSDVLAIPQEGTRTPHHPGPSPHGVPIAQPEKPRTGPVRIPDPKTGPIRAVTPPVASDSPEVAPLEAMIDEGRLDEALAGYRVLAKKHPQDHAYRAGVELCEGLKALAARDRLEAAQRFEAALELDPSNERAARELADMRRQATNERKGLLSRLMGKKEPPT